MSQEITLRVSEASLRGIVKKIARLSDYTMKKTWYRDWRLY